WHAASIAVLRQLLIRRGEAEHLVLAPRVGLLDDLDFTAVADVHRYRRDEVLDLGGERRRGAALQERAAGRLAGAGGEHARRGQVDRRLAELQCRDGVEVVG